MENKNSFVLYTDYFEQIEILNMEQRGILLTACMLYQLGKELPKMDPVTKMCYLFISADIRRNNEKYERIVEQRAEAGRKGGMQTQANKTSQANQANATFATFASKSKSSKIKQNQANQANASDNDNDNVNVNVNDNVNGNVDVNVNEAVTGPETEPNKQPTNKSTNQQINQQTNNPTFKEIADEIAEQGYTVSATKFFDHYEKNGWLTNDGKPVTNWRSMLRVWHLMDRNNPPDKKRKKNPFNNFDQREYSNEDLETMLLDLGRVANG